MTESAQIIYGDGYKYQLKSDVWIQTRISGQQFSAEFYRMTPDGMLFVRDGYAWDGASGVTIDTMSSMRGALAHDVLYQAMRAGQLGHEFFTAANEELRRICIADGMWTWRANLWFKAVEKFGSAHAAVQLEEIHLAPKL